MKQYYHVVCGGTFDHFHKGHEIFIQKVLESGENISIGLTSDEFVKNKENSSQIEPFKIRKKILESHLLLLKTSHKIEIIPIDSPFGLTLKKESRYEAIVVSKETVEGAQKINSKRQEKGLSLLDIIMAPPFFAEDGQLLSSSRIRNGEVNREGRLYLQKKWLHHTLFLPENLRSELQQPFGILIKGDVTKELLRTKYHLAPVDNLVAVGDIVTSLFNSLSLDQTLSVVDFQVERKKRFSHVKEHGFDESVQVISVENPNGSITAALSQKVDQLFRGKRAKRSVLVVNGEEDLVVLPIVLAAPLGFQIWYGQPKIGMVKVDVSETSKQKAFEIVNRFKIDSKNTRGH